MNTAVNRRQTEPIKGISGSAALPACVLIGAAGAAIACAILYKFRTGKKQALSGKVIDVSEFQPEKINWTKVRKAGLRVILRMGIRGSLASNPDRYKKLCYDYHYKAYLEGVIKAGIPYTVYFFPTSVTDQEAEQEADWIIMNLAGAVLDMPVFLDCEYVFGRNGEQGRANDLTREQRTRFLKRITDKLVDAGIPCGIYGNIDWLKNKIDLDQLQDQVVDNTWVAEYESTCSYDSRYALWQFTSKGKVDGIKGNVDMSVIKGTFNMSCRKKTEKPADRDAAC